MRLEQSHIDKIDPLLQDALKRAKRNEILRTVMLLSPVEEAGRERGDQAPDPSQFSSRVDYRRALIEHRQVQLADDIDPTLQALRDMSLTPRGGMIGPVVVIEGTAGQIVASLDLPGVRHASLDRPIILIEPRSRGERELER